MDRHEIDKTMVFKPVNEEKPLVRREEAPIFNDTVLDEYDGYEESREGNKTLITVSLILAIVIVIAIAAVVIILSRDDKNEEIPPERTEQENVVMVQDDTDGEEEEEKIESFEIVSYNAIFYSSSAVEEDGEIIITATLYDNNMRDDKKRHLIINSDTDIRVNGDRLKDDAFLYLIEGKEQEGLIFSVEIEEESGILVSISYDGKIVEEEESEGVVVDTPEETEETPGNSGGIVSDANE